MIPPVNSRGGRREDDGQARQGKAKGELVELLGMIRRQVGEFDPNLVRDSETYDAACLCLLLATGDLPETWDEIQVWAADVLEREGDRIPQMITNLRLGGALEESGFHDAIHAGLGGNDGGIVLALLQAVATGHMIYHHESNKWEASPLGKIKFHP